MHCVNQQKSLYIFHLSLQWIRLIVHKPPARTGALLDPPQGWNDGKTWQCQWVESSSLGKMCFGSEFRHAQPTNAVKAGLYSFLDSLLTRVRVRLAEKTTIVSSRSRRHIPWKPRENQHCKTALYIQRLSVNWARCQFHVPTICYQPCARWNLTANHTVCCRVSQNFWWLNYRDAA